MTMADIVTETYTHRDGFGHLPTARWSRDHQHLLNLCVTHLLLILRLVANILDFFALAGLKDPFLCTVIIS